MITIGQDPLTLDQVETISCRAESVSLASVCLERTARSHQTLAQLIDGGTVVYGVTTGFGDSCQVAIPAEQIPELPRNLFRFHGCGLGDDFSRDETRAILVARLASLTTGLSGVRPVVLDKLVDLLNCDVLPCIPSIGSVGASGDLTPLSYLAAVLSGEQSATHKGQRLSAADALAQAGLHPLELQPKESLALMNGTSAMTGVAALCVPRALRLTRWAAALTAVCSDVLCGQPRHFDPRLFRAKPHPGQALTAAWIRDDLEFEQARAEAPARVQDRYSLRCAPHVLGVLVDFLPQMIAWIETELQGANDNPLIDPDSAEVLHGGNFYGGHVCAAMDTLKTQVANVVDLLDRQLALLCNPTTNHGLPSNLVGVPQEQRPAHHGFKAMQIATSALAAETAKLAMPASVFSRSTENHNQDKVSMGTIAARDCARALQLAEQTAAIVTLACVQGVDLRQGQGCHVRAQQLHESVRKKVPRLEEDRAMRQDIDVVLAMAQAGELPWGHCRLDDVRELPEP